MALTENALDQNIATTIPVAISYGAIVNYLRNKFMGEILSKERANGKSTAYAEIVGISLSDSLNENFDLEVVLNLKLLTMLYKNKLVDIKIDASIYFDSQQQTVAIDDYEIDSKGLNYFADNLLESVVNKFMYGKLKERLNVDLMPKLQEELDKINQQLANKFEAKKGVNIIGAMDKLEIADIKARQSKLWIFIAIMGWAVVEIDEISI